MALADTLPPLVVGTAHMGGPFLGFARDRAGLFRHLDALVDLGLVAFDLAASYQVGGTERLFGAWLAERAERSRASLFLMTKGGHPLPLVAPHRLGRRALTSDLEASLSRLRTDRIDLYWLHRDDEHTPLEDIVQTLSDFQKSGKIGAYGLSNWRHDRVESLRQTARRAGLPEPSAVSPHYSLFSWRRAPWSGCVSIAGDQAALAYYRQAGLPVFAWSPLASGYLGNPRASGGAYDSQENEARRKRLLELAQTRGIRPTGLLLAYLKNTLPLAFPVVASSESARMEQNLRALELHLDPSEIAFLEGHPAEDSKQAS